MSDAKPTDTDIANAAREVSRRYALAVEIESALKMAKSDLTAAAAKLDKMVALPRKGTADETP